MLHGVEQPEPGTADIYGSVSMYSLQGRRLFLLRMTQMLRDAARRVRSSLMSEREARAHGAQSQGFRHFAAQMPFNEFEQEPGRQPRNTFVPPICSI